MPTKSHFWYQFWSNVNWAEKLQFASKICATRPLHWPYCFHVLFQINPKTFPVGVPFLSYTRPYFMKIIFQSKRIIHSTKYKKNCLHLKFSYYWPLQYTLQGFFKMTSDFRSHFCGYCKCSLSKNDNNNLVQKCPFVL